MRESPVWRQRGYLSSDKVALVVENVCYLEMEIARKMITKALWKQLFVLNYALAQEFANSKVFLVPADNLVNCWA